MRVVCNSVCAFVFRRTRDSVEFLLLRRTHDRGRFWQPVTGRVEKREMAEDAARREVFEETSFKTVEFVFLDKVHVYFKPGKKRVYVEPCFGIGIEGGDPVLSKEHDTFAWLSFDEASKTLPHSGLREALGELNNRLAELPSHRLRLRELVSPFANLPFKEARVERNGPSKRARVAGQRVEDHPDDGHPGDGHPAIAPLETEEQQKHS